MRTIVAIMAAVLVVGSALTGLAEVPRLASGKPDLQGNWDFRTLTPFERPGRYGDREFLTDEEISGWEEAVRVGGGGGGPGGGKKNPGGKGGHPPTVTTKEFIAGGV